MRDLSPMLESKWVNFSPSYFLHLLSLLSKVTAPCFMKSFYGIWNLILTFNALIIETIIDFLNFSPKSVLMVDGVPYSPIQYPVLHDCCGDCFSVKIDLYDEVVNHCINKTLIFIMMHYSLNTNQTRYYNLLTTY